MKVAVDLPKWAPISSFVANYRGGRSVHIALGFQKIRENWVKTPLSIHILGYDLFDSEN